MGTALVLDRALSPGALMSFYALIGYLTGPLVRAHRREPDGAGRADRRRPALRDPGPGAENGPGRAMVLAARPRGRCPLRGGGLPLRHAGAGVRRAHPDDPAGAVHGGGGGERVGEEHPGVAPARPLSGGRGADPHRRDRPSLHRRGEPAAGDRSRAAARSTSSPGNVVENVAARRVRTRTWAGSWTSPPSWGSPSSWRCSPPGSRPRSGRTGRCSPAASGSGSRSPGRSTVPPRC